MNAIFQFSSAQEITSDIIDVIRRAYREKPVSIYVQEYDPIVPEWQIQEMRRLKRFAEIRQVFKSARHVCRRSFRQFR